MEREESFVVLIRRLNNFQAEGWSLTFWWSEVLLIGGDAGIGAGAGGDGAGAGGDGAGAEGDGAGARILKSSILSAIGANVGLSSGS